MEKIYYTTIDKPSTYEIPKIKGSRFIGNIFPITNKEEAELYINEIKKTYHDATHTCYAYVYGTKITYDLFGQRNIISEYITYSDEGEPKNTAGKPILAQIQGHKLQNVLITVTRYFWGTLLGIWGLIQAYGTCAKKVIEHSHKTQKECTKILSITYPFDNISWVKNILKKYQAHIIQETYTTHVECTIQINIWTYEKCIQEIWEITKWKVIYHI